MEADVNSGPAAGAMTGGGAEADSGWRQAVVSGETEAVILEQILGVFGWFLGRFKLDFWLDVSSVKFSLDY